MPGTTTISRPKRQPKEPEIHTDPGWKVVIFNDDVTPIDVVVYGLQRAAGLSIEVAVMVAQEAHEQDSAVVKRGLSEDDAKIICGGLRKWTRIEGVCPGVRCEAQREES